MIDILAPLGLAFMVLFVVVLVRTARKQQRERSSSFRALAGDRQWTFLETDDGTAERLAEGFRDFAVFHSASLGEKRPRNVVLGAVPEGRVCLFEHGTRVYEGHARLWTICLLESGDRLGPRMRIRPRGVPRVREPGDDPVVSLDDDRFERRFEVRSPEPDEVRTRLDTATRDLILQRADELRFQPEVQVVGRRVAAYPARRNDQAEDAAELEELLRFTREVARRLSSPAS